MDGFEALEVLTPADRTPDRIEIAIYRHRSGAAPAARQAFDEHRTILAARQARDGALAGTLMRQHIRRAPTLLEQGAH